MACLLEAGYLRVLLTPEDRRASPRQGEDPKLGYDGFDRPGHRSRRFAIMPSCKPVLRLPDEDITFTDLIRGEIKSLCACDRAPTAKFAVRWSTPSMTRFMEITTLRGE